MSVHHLLIIISVACANFLPSFQPQLLHISTLNMSNAIFYYPTSKKKDEATPKFYKSKNQLSIIFLSVFNHDDHHHTCVCLVYVCKYKIMIITQGMKIFAHTIEILLNTQLSASRRRICGVVVVVAPKPECVYLKINLKNWMQYNHEIYCGYLFIFNKRQCTVSEDEFCITNCTAKSCNYSGKITEIVHTVNPPTYFPLWSNKSVTTTRQMVDKFVVF